MSRPPRTGGSDDGRSEKRASQRASQRERALAQGQKAVKTKRGQKALDKQRRRTAASARPRTSRTPTAADQRPARNFSGRSVALLMVLFLAAVVLVPSLRLMFSQQAELAEAHATLEAEKAREESLLRQLERWEDDAYVQQQARERFNMVMPGERKYMVVGEEMFDQEDTSSTAGGPGGGADEGAQTSQPYPDAWADDLWGSFVQSALH